MWSNCCKVLLLKYSRSYSMYLCKRFRLAIENSLQTNVSYNNGVHRFSVYNSLLVDYKKGSPEKNEDNDPYKRKYRQKSFREVLRHAEKFDNYLENSITVKRVIDILDKAAENEKWSKRDIEIILKSQGFVKFLNAVKSYIEELPMKIDSELFKLLKIYNYLRIPFSNPICTDILLALKERLNFLSFSQKAEFYLVLNSDKSTIKMKLELIKKLQESLIVNLQDEIYTHSVNYAALSLIICHNDFVPNEVRVNVLKHILELPEWNNFAMFKHFLKVLNKLGWNHPNYNLMKYAFFEKINNHLDNIQFSLAFLTGYASLLHQNEIHYDDKLIDKIVNSITDLNQKTSPFVLAKLTKALAAARHVNYDILEYILEIMKNNPADINKSTELCKNCIQLLADSNHDEKVENRWDVMHPFIRRLLTQSNFFHHFENDFEAYLHCVVRLASLGIYDYESLRLLSSYINEFQDLKLSVNLKYTIGMLNQVIRVLNPAFKESFLNDNVLSFIINELDNFNAVPFQKRKMLLDMNDRLYQASHVKRAMLLNAFTKCGMLIDGVVAMNNEGELYSFTECKKGEVIFIENISLPENYKLITLMALSTFHYSRNTRSLKSYCSLQLKTLKAMGYHSVHIFEEDWWNELRNNNQGQYLLNKIREKCCTRTLSSSVEAPLKDSGD